MKRLIILPLLMVVGACGVPDEKYNRTLDALKKAEADRDACVTDRDGLKQKSDQATAELSKLKGELGQSEEQLQGTQKTMAATQKELEELRKQHAEAQKRLEAFQKLTARFQKMIDAGKLKVGIRNGQMVLKLPAGILFASGKADLSKDGQAAISEVAAILKDFSDRHFLIAGHTDNKPLGHGDKFKDNWELSTARAVTVTRFLVAQGVSAQNVVAAGYGEFDPVGDNASDEGRQENRRIEIVLLPNLSEMPMMPKEAGTN